MSLTLEERLERINRNGFRVHQAYQRYKITSGGDADDPDLWYWDVNLVAWNWANGSPWDYFHGEGQSLEEALRDAYKKGKVKKASLEGLKGKALYYALNPSQDPDNNLKPKTTAKKAKRRVRL